LQQTLRSHKCYSNREISNILGVKKTKVDHWFRTDDCFAIPDAELWNQLKELLKIETTAFDESILTFEEKDGVYEKANRCYDEEGLSPTLTATSSNEKIISNYKIRKLTPRECYRLMGWKDEQFDKIHGISDAQLYKTAGNGIVIPVLEAIFEKMFK
jgi:DNA (cytosine-5)-methyltransferase 1